MNILVIGGTRDFGKVTVRKLLERGDNVTVYSRGNVRPEFWNDVEHIAGDRTDHTKFIDQLSKKHYDAVIDNVAYTFKDVQAAISAFSGNIGRYIVSSTVSVYGGPGHAISGKAETSKSPGSKVDEFIDLSRHCPLMENDLDLSTVSWARDDSVHEYAEGKRQIERLLFENKDFPSTVMRIPSVLGPDENGNRFWFYMQRIADGKEIIMRDGGSAIFRPGFRDDVAQSFVDVIDEPVTINNTYNISGLEIVSLKTFMQTIADALDMPLNGVDIPGNIAEGESDLPWDDWFYDFFSRPLLYVPSILRAKTDFGIKTTPLANWVKTTVEWYSSNDIPDSNGYEKRDMEIELCLKWQKEYSEFTKGAFNR
ncbi:MAG: Nucleoside-diphosphate-sugar epimerase [Chloroflexi bacterium]|jgi:nucleoside-diphosphate-sugar epimerase|nr:MAG: Nucleoside-diphosphate-sugar epimerase [Chloroflexota bacterium]